MIRILLIAEIRMYREGLARCLERRPGLEVIGAVAESRQARPLIEELSPDVVLLDMDVPESVATIRVVTTTSPATKVLALSVRDADHNVIACAEAGVSGCLTRDQSIDDVVGAIEALAKDEVLVTPRVAAALLRRVATMAAGRIATGQHLTDREREIVALIDDGLSNKEIAGRLCIEPPTVKNHVHNILEKLGVRKRGEAAAWLRANLPAAADRRASGAGRRAPPGGDMARWSSV